MATFAELYRQCDGKPFKCYPNGEWNNTATFDGFKSFKWDSTGSDVSAISAATWNWELRPPEPTVEEILLEAGYTAHKNGMDVRVQSGTRGAFIWMPLSRFPTTAAAARELVAFLDKYR